MQIRYNINKCELCEKEQSSKTIGQHLRYSHKLTAKEYFDKFYKTDTNSKCVICGKPTTFKCISFGYSVTCSWTCKKILAGKQSKQVWSNKTKEDIEKENIKRKETCRKLYGVDSIFQLRTHEQAVAMGYRARQIQFEYEKQDPNFIPVFARPEVREKYKQTMIERYGVDSNLKIPGNLELFVTRKREKNNGKYFSQESLDKRKYTNLTRYGAEHYAQSANAKISKSLYQYDCLNFDSSWELVYYIWLKHNNIEFEFHPNIRLQYMIDEKQHYYKPDFIVNNELVEIKGDYLVKRMPHEKYECMLTNNVKILFYNDIKPILKWYKENFTIPLSDYKYKKE